MDNKNNNSELNVNVNNNTQPTMPQGSINGVQNTNVTPPAPQASIPVQQQFVPQDQPEPSASVPTNNVTEENVQAEPKKTFNKDAFNSEEKIIYEIKEPKQGNPIVVILFFVIMIAFVIFLPNISNTLKKYFNNTPQISTPAPIVNNNTTDDKEEITKYRFGDAINVAEIGDLAINNVILSKNDVTGEYFASFTTVNNGSKPYTFDKKYYMIFYSGEKLVYRALIHSYDAIDSFVSAQISLPITQSAYQQANSFLVEEITTERYPDVTLKDSDGDLQTLTCTHLNTEITYYFKDNLLEKISETYTTSKQDNINYDRILQEKNQMSTEYNQITGITSIMENHEESGYFILRNNFDLVNIQDKTLTDLKNYSYFRYHETSKIVSFEIQTQGYTCS